MIITSPNATNIALVFILVSKAAMQCILFNVDLYTKSSLINRRHFKYMHSLYAVVTTTYAVILQ